ncbi:MAG: hemolysin family protein [Actinomycetota bacterium]|nr:hemolysin family protein [Actinomycetota bacterium]
MTRTLLNVGIVLALILVEGVFVAAEIALVSLREGQVRAQADRDRRGAAVARLARNPNRFLAAAQIGVTVAALLSSAVGAVTLSETARNALVRAGMGRTPAGFLGVVGVTLVISFVTLVIGELAPKRLGLQRPEGTARLLGPTLDRLASMARPLIWLLSATTNGVVRLLGADPHANRDAITEEELRGLVAAHESLTRDERRLIDEVFAAGERQIREVMVPRTEVDFLEAGMTVSRAGRLAHPSPHSRFPVFGESQDDVVGFVHIRDLLRMPSTDRTRTVGDLSREVKRLPDSKRVLPALSEMRREGHHLAIVVDEYGGTAGIVTLEDLIEEVIGDIRDEYDAPAPDAAGGGPQEVDGLLNLDEFAERTGVTLPDGPYETAAGYVMAVLGSVPALGDAVEVDGRQLTVCELDGRRIARLRVTPAEPAEAPAGDAAPGSGAVA